MNQSSCGLVLEIANQYERPGGLSPDELLSAGNAGLREAIKRFDPERGEKLSAYARRWIERSIKKALKLGRVPTDKEISPQRSRLRSSPESVSLPPVSFDDDTRTEFMCVLTEAGLDDREREIISLRYGAADGVPKTHKQIGKKLGLTRERISQLEKAGREKLEKLC